jgi:hypothetical protein
MLRSCMISPGSGRSQKNHCVAAEDLTLLAGSDAVDVRLADAWDCVAGREDNLLVITIDFLGSCPGDAC